MSSVICASSSEPASLSKAKANKPELAHRYVVGIRTIENWTYRQIIQGAMEGGELVYDVSECDRRLMSYGKDAGQKTARKPEAK